ncbi:MAG: twin-arginine translocase subunit TatC [Acidobacteria bacterium]|mgnify:CR=1 FL=1|nr:MAG: twin-arginine translocase subunit TatC [Acidobacteriota bacterium]
MEDTGTATENHKEKQELASMGFLEHLEELRKRIIWSAIPVVVGFFVCYAWHERIFSWMQKPITDALLAHHLPVQLVYTNPIDPFNLYIKISMLMGIFVASPFVLYQVWAFIAPGLYKRERRYVAPFMISTVGLFVTGGFFAYKVVYPSALEFLVAYSAQFTPMITINEYTQLFLTIVLGLGVVFEMPVLVFFLALFGILSADFMWRNFRYAIFIIFVIAAIITPTPDIMNMCLFAAPMIVLYTISIAVAYLVHPKQRKKRAESSN